MTAAAGASQRDDMASALAEGGTVGFYGRDRPQDDVEAVTLRQDGAAFVATRIDGSTLGVFASLDAALSAIEAELMAS